MFRPSPFAPLWIGSAGFLALLCLLRQDLAASEVSVEVTGGLTKLSGLFQEIVVPAPRNVPHGLAVNWTDDTGTSVILNRKKLRLCQRAIEADPELGLDIAWANTAKKIDVLYEFPSLRRLQLHFLPGTDLEPLYSLQRLETLTVSSGEPVLNLRRFKSLRGLHCEWKSVKDTIQYCRRLTSLSILDYRSETKDLSELSRSTRLKSLALSQPGISSLGGLDVFGDLRKLTLSYCPTLRCIDGLRAVAKTLVDLRMEWCKNLERVEETIPLLTRLAKLALCSKGLELKSIKFIDGMSELRFFSFVDTKILDGDMTPCIRLDHAGFDDKRHYSHKYNAIKRMIQNRSA